jgi:hypothetical protein
MQLSWLSFSRLSNTGLLSCILACLCTVLNDTPVWASLSYTCCFLVQNSASAFRNCYILSKISWPWLQACAITHSSTHHTQCKIWTNDINKTTWAQRFSHTWLRVLSSTSVPCGIITVYPSLGSALTWSVHESKRVQQHYHSHLENVTDMKKSQNISQK